MIESDVHETVTPVETDRVEDRMRCRRCGGLMVMEPCMDFWDDTTHVMARRCVQCGDLIDPVILQNRGRGPALRTAR